MSSLTFEREPDPNSRNFWRTAKANWNWFIHFLKPNP